MASIFHRFWWISEAKLGRKIEQKSIQKGIEKQMPKRRRLGGVLEASWAMLGQLSPWQWEFREGSAAARGVV
ncbi:MAG: hypothetical protein VX034_15470 [Planctomycetota bacterium]|nr:hypothetical protein [Planctomycetota bacterium]